MYFVFVCIKLVHREFFQQLILVLFTNPISSEMPVFSPQIYKSEKITLGTRKTSNKFWWIIIIIIIRWGGLWRRLEFRRKFKSGEEWPNGLLLKESMWHACLQIKGENIIKTVYITSKNVILV